MWLRLGLVLVSVILILTSNPVGAEKYTIDGDVSDWGIDLRSGLQNNINAWIPTSSTADWVVEDDVYSGYSGYSSGVHITSVESGYATYVEEKITWFWKSGQKTKKVVQPSGGEPWDVEALYFDDDERYIYFAIILSNNLPFKGLCTKHGIYTGLGDLYLEVVRNGIVKKYGVVLKEHQGLKVGEIIEDPKWYDDLYEYCSGGERGWKEIDKSLIVPGGEKVGNAEVVIKRAQDSSGYIDDHGKPNYVIEIKIDRKLVGYPQSGDAEMKFSVSCGNDIIKKKVSYNYNTIPEFYAIIIPAGIILGFFQYYRSRKN